MIERNTTLTRPQVRGTVRLALKEGGLRPTLVGAQQMMAVVEQLMPSRLVAQGLTAEDSKKVCDSVIARLRGLESEQPAVGPGEMLNRLDKARRDS